jgi:hypothetical protein
MPGLAAARLCDASGGRGGRGLMARPGIIPVLVEGGYDGYLSSEYEGNRHAPRYQLGLMIST